MTHQQKQGYNQGINDAYDGVIVAIKEWGKATKRITISIDELSQFLQAAKEFRKYQNEKQKNEIP